MSRVLFLDIDGVLNDHKWNREAGSCTLLGDCVKRLNKIIDVCDPDVVLSSAWRYMVHKGAVTLQGFEYLLRTHGVTQKIRLVGLTPMDEEILFRRDQIKFWMKDKVITAYVVLDDLEEVSPDVDRQVQTDSKIGLTDKDVEAVIKLFNET